MFVAGDKIALTRAELGVPVGSTGHVEQNLQRHQRNDEAVWVIWDNKRFFPRWVATNHLTKR